MLKIKVFFIYMYNPDTVKAGASINLNEHIDSLYIFN